VGVTEELPVRVHAVVVTVGVETVVQSGECRTLTIREVASSARLDRLEEELGKFDSLSRRGERAVLWIGAWWRIVGDGIGAEPVGGCVACGVAGVARALRAERNDRCDGACN
jgi:hypothetical protein